MSFYEKRILPKMIHYACGIKANMKQREKIVPQATDKVLEIGIGSGLNLSYYQKDKVSSLVGIDPSLETWEVNKNKREDLAVEFIQAGAERLPFEKDSFDTIVVTYTMCTIPDLLSALSEMRRVLKSSGQLLFCEHGKAPDAGVLKWQNRINPIWKKLAGGCNLNKDIPQLLTDNGFKVKDLQTMYIPGPKFLCFNYWGSAKLR
jgi:ubiquinone/menaquinone biosynthesis C-methylase UbiE